MKVAIAAGGTGGHLMPGLAVAEVLRARGHEPLIFISEKTIDSLATRDRTEFKYEKLPGIGMPKLLSPAMIGFIRRFWEGMSACKFIYNRFKPDAVLGMGGFTSTAPILAARKHKVPTFLHESNAIPGKANKLNAKISTVVFLGFPECERHFPGASCEVTGTPIRESLCRPVAREEALAAFGLSPKKRTVLVAGGSQGAQGINDALIQALPHLKRLDIQIIHLTGSAQEQVMTANYRREGIPAHVAAFCHQMEYAYAAADLAISRSGAASLTELAHFGVPPILIPYPHAAENHQALNAEIFGQEKAAVVLDQSQVTAESLIGQIESLLDDPRKLARMSAKMHELAPDGAAERVVDAIERHVGKREAQK